MNLKGDGFQDFGKLFSENCAGSMMEYFKVFRFLAILRVVFLLLIRAGTVFAAEVCFFSIDSFTIASFIYFASAVSANFKARFNGYRNQFGKSVE
jgi:hypothetical protein